MEQNRIYAIRHVSGTPAGSFDKPLPNLPLHDSPRNRKPVAPISGNTQKPLSRIRSLFKLRSTSPAHKGQRLQRRKSMTLEMQLRSPIRKFRKQERRPQADLPQVDLLSEKILHLESQLTEARRQLDFAVETTRDRHSLQAVNSSMVHVRPRQPTIETQPKELQVEYTPNTFPSGMAYTIMPITSQDSQGSQAVTTAGQSDGDASTRRWSGSARHRRTSSEINISIGALSDEVSSSQTVASNCFKFPRDQNLDTRPTENSRKPSWQSANVTLFDDIENEIDLDMDVISPPPSPSRRHVPSPSRLRCVQEEYEWDEDVF